MTRAKQGDTQQKVETTQEQIEQQNREMVAKYKEALTTETLAEQVERHKREIAAMDARDAADAAAGLTNEHMNRIMRADIMKAHSQQRLALEKSLSGRKGESEHEQIMESVTGAGAGNFRMCGLRPGPKHR